MVMKYITDKLNKKTVLLFLCTLSWMGLIFYFSAQPADSSKEASGKVLESIMVAVKWIFGQDVPCFSAGIFLETDHYVRKAGHAFEYLVLGALVVMLVKTLGIRRVFLISLLVCASYAVSDELHQMFVPGRGPMASDVALDTSASAAAILLNVCYTKFIHQKDMKK